MKSNITEGLRSNSLDHLILPMLTVDEYESKIDDKRVIVVGFFVFDQDPAYDLSGFIDSSTDKILDTEVSPAPTPEGYYITFVEILRNKEFTKVLLQLLGEIENLSDITAWQMQVPHQAEPIDISTETINEYIILDPNDIEDSVDVNTSNIKKKKKNAKLSEDVDFWKLADLDHVSFDDEYISFTKNNKSWTYQVSADIPITNINLLETQDAAILQSLLGHAYNVYRMSDVLVVESNQSVKVLKIVD